jgi:hypothetical protein
MRYMVKGSDSTLTIDHDELGWVLNAQRKTITRINSCGERITSNTPISSYVIRTPKVSDGIRVLFIGDSTTHATEVSTGFAYYDVFEAVSQEKYSVWAAGAGGYGNYQEYVLLTKLYDTIRPEIVVWQLDSNDVVNNVYQLDSATIVNNMNLRPYLDPSTGKVEVKFPGWSVFRVSHGARSLLARMVAFDYANGAKLISTIDQMMSPSLTERQRLVQQGFDVLDRVLSNAIKRYPGTKFFGFSISSGEDDEYGKIFHRNGAEYWPNMARHVRQSGERTDCLPLDSHWNHAGHRAAGILIAELVRKTI